MKPVLIDTNIVSMYLRGQREVRDRIAAYFKAHEKLYLSIITQYEILSGLEHRDAHKQMERFCEFSTDCEICSLTEAAVRASSKLYAKLRKTGQAVDDLDLLIAGIALANDLVMVTHNRKHFDRIEGLIVEDWSESVS